MTCLVFLELNGYEFTAPEDALVEIVFAFARSELTKADIAVFLCKWTAKWGQYDQAPLDHVQRLEHSIEMIRQRSFKSPRAH